MVGFIGKSDMVPFNKLPTWMMTWAGDKQEKQLLVYNICRRYTRKEWKAKDGTVVPANCSYLSIRQAALACDVSPKKARQLIDDLIAHSGGQLTRFEGAHSGTHQRAHSGTHLNPFLQWSCDDLGQTEGHTKGHTEGHKDQIRGTDEDQIDKPNGLSGATEKRFTPPSIEDVHTYAPDIDAEHFWHHHNARGWILSNGKKMKNWKSAVVTWRKNNVRFPEARESTALPPPAPRVDTGPKQETALARLAREALESGRSLPGF